MTEFDILVHGIRAVSAGSVCDARITDQPFMSVRLIAGQSGDVSAHFDFFARTEEALHY
jgi:hypothetical protein